MIRWVPLVLLTLSACTETLLDDLGETEANDVVARLTEVGVTARKASAGGGRYRVEVPPERFALAWATARAAGYPHHPEPSPPARLVVGPSEAAARARVERGRLLSRLIRAAPGVLDARVVLGDEGHVAAVVRIRPGPATISADRLRTLLAAGAGASAASPASIVLELHPVPQGARVTKAVVRQPDARLLAAAGAVLALVVVLLALLRRLRTLERGERRT